MTIALPTHARPKSRGTLLGAAFALGLGTLLLGAAPADARNEFKNGFEDAFGRIVAHHVAAIGHAVIAPAVVFHEQAHYAPPIRRHYRPHYNGHHVYKRRQGRHYRGHGHRHHAGCGHGFAPIRVSVRDGHHRSDRHHRRGQYARHDRYNGHDGHQRQFRQNRQDQHERRSRHSY